ncbi:unnamed protein product [Calicophoron daubneyi]|uniref:CID domain-containing protein n=1 Tax=Calicophoron daubneyi TaxID=300641 RepID=A0AAV2TZZ6_CALDB
MDQFSFIKEQVRQKLFSANLCSKHVKDAASFILTLAEHAENIAKLWLETFKSADNPAFQLALLYVANEIISKCSKYGVSEFREIFKPFMVQAVQHLRPGHLIPKLKKLYGYWSRYQLFDPKFTQKLLADLDAAESGKKMGDDSNANIEEMLKGFNPETFIECLRKLKQLDEDLAQQSKPDVSAFYLDVPIEKTVGSVKSKNESRALSMQVNLCCKNLEGAIKKYTDRLEQLKSVDDLLNVAQLYYESQQKEVDIVVNAYKTYGLRVSKTLASATELVKPQSDRAGPSCGSQIITPVSQDESPKLTPGTDTRRSQELSSGDEAEALENFADDLAYADDDDNSDMDEPGPSNDKVDYHPSPILPLKDAGLMENSDSLTPPQSRIAHACGAELAPKPSPNVIPPKKSPLITDLIPPSFDDHSLDLIRDEAGDVDYRLLLDPARRAMCNSQRNDSSGADEPSQSHPSRSRVPWFEQDSAHRSLDQAAKVSGSPAPTKELSTTSTPVATALATSVQLSTSVCHDEDGDSMEMSDDDEPDLDDGRSPVRSKQVEEVSGEREEKTMDALGFDAGPLDPSALDTGDHDWRLLMHTNTHCTPVHAVSAAATVPQPVRAPVISPPSNSWRPSISQFPVYIPGPIPQPPRPFPSMVIPPPPPPPTFASLPTSPLKPPVLPPVPPAPLSGTLGFAHPDGSHHPPLSPPPPVSSTSSFVHQLPPKTRLPDGILPTFPKPPVELSLPFPPLTPVAVTTGADSLLSTMSPTADTTRASPKTPAPLDSTTTEQKPSVVQPTSTSAASTTVSSSQSFSSPGQNAPTVPSLNPNLLEQLRKIVEKAKPSSKSVSETSATHSPQPEPQRPLQQSEDPFAVISRLTGLSNLMKGLATKTEKSDVSPIATTPAPSVTNLTQVPPDFRSDRPAPVADFDMRIMNNLPSSGHLTTDNDHAASAPGPAKRQRLSDNPQGLEEEVKSKPTLAVEEKKSHPTPISSALDVDSRLQNCQSESDQNNLSPSHEELDKVEVLETLTQGSETSSQGGETPTQDERDTENTDLKLPLNSLFSPSVSLANFLIPASIPAPPATAVLPPPPPPPPPSNNAVNGISLVQPQRFIVPTVASSVPSSSLERARNNITTLTNTQQNLRMSSGLQDSPQMSMDWIPPPLLCGSNTAVPLAIPIPGPMVSFPSALSTSQPPPPGFTNTLPGVLSNSSHQALYFLPSHQQSQTHLGNILGVPSNANSWPYRVPVPTGPTPPHATNSFWNMIRVSHPPPINFVDLLASSAVSSNSSNIGLNDRQRPP